MSDPIKHECGIALIRLLKPLNYYISKYGTPLYGLNTLNLLMEKQRNRGQDGAGIGSIKFDLKAGKRYMDRIRSTNPKAIEEIFKSIQTQFKQVYNNNPDNFKDEEFLKNNVSFTGELLLGHLRYATHSKNGSEFCHPRIRTNNWKSRNLMVAGNFNMTNNDELFDLLIEIGQHPKDMTDTVTVMEKIGHFLDEENELLYQKFKAEGYTNQVISTLIAENLEPANVLRRAVRDFDGGFAMAGLIGHGDAFLLRDPAGIRPAFFYQNDEIVVAASERPALQTALNVKYQDIQEVKPGHALVIKRNGRVTQESVLDPLPKASCSFERIYFSRGTDKDIYQERKTLGKLVTPAVLEAADHDIERTVFSYIPNTAETSYLGLVEGVHDYLVEYKKQEILKGVEGDELDRILSILPRAEKIPVKDAKLRTFITVDDDRNEMVSHAYDTTYGVIRRGVDTLVVIDDSIVRGTTLKKSILSILDRLGPKRIVVVSSAPQIRYPDCYGIDMSKLHDFVAFKAAIQLLKENYKSSVIEEVYKKCKSQAYLPKEEVVNHVKAIYEPFTDQQISDKIGEIVRPSQMTGELKIIYQNVENLHKACPDHKGDWYFTGNYPTPGGNKVVNRAFINFYEGIDARSY